MKNFLGFTFSCKSFRSDLLTALLRSRKSRSSQTKLRSASSYGFTLAETMIVLILIGIVITITMPSIIKKYELSVKRAKVKKAMIAYDTAVHNMYEGQSFVTKESFLNWANAENAADCANTKSYFKPVDSLNGCVFKTADGIWWDITNIANPIIILNQKYVNCLNGSTDKCSRDTLLEMSKSGTDSDTNIFTMTLQVDENTGMLHVNDKIFEEEIDENSNNTKYLSKLINFIHNQAYTSDVVVPEINLNPNVNTNTGNNGNENINNNENENENNENSTLCKNNNGTLCNGWDHGSDGTCPENYNGLMCLYVDGIGTNSKTCGTQSDMSKTIILDENTGEKLLLKYNAGNITEVQYTNTNKLIEVYQKTSSKERVAKYLYDEEGKYKQSWFVDPKNNNKFTFMQMQYYDESSNAYYIFTASPADQNSNQYKINFSLSYKSDKPFSVESSEVYSTNGTQETLGQKTIQYSKASLEADCLNSCNATQRALLNAFNDGYFNQPDKTQTGTFEKLEKNISAYHKYACMK